MFGDKSIFGRSEVKIDNKGRIFIPAFTNKEEGDELVLVYNDLLSVHEIYSVSTLEEKFKLIEQKMNASKNKKDQIYYEKMLYQLSKAILRNSKVDSQGRMLIGKTTFEGEEKILATGAYDHLIIEPVKKK